MEKKGKFDYILLETTGLADPGMAHFAGLKYKQSYETCRFVNVHYILIFQVTFPANRVRKQLDW